MYTIWGILGSWKHVFHNILGQLFNDSIRSVTWKSRRRAPVQVHLPWLPGDEGGAPEVQMLAVYQLRLPAEQPTRKHHMKLYCGLLAYPPWISTRLYLLTLKRVNEDTSWWNDVWQLLYMHAETVFSFTSQETVFCSKCFPQHWYQRLFAVVTWTLVAS